MVKNSDFLTFFKSFSNAIEFIVVMISFCTELLKYVAFFGEFFHLLMQEAE